MNGRNKKIRVAFVFSKIQILHILELFYSGNKYTKKKEKKKQLSAKFGVGVDERNGADVNGWHSFRHNNLKALGQLLFSLAAGDAGNTKVVA